MFIDHVLAWFPIISAIASIGTAVFMLWLTKNFVTRAEREADHADNLAERKKADESLKEYLKSAKEALDIEIEARRNTDTQLAGAKARIEMLEQECKMPPSRNDLREDIQEFGMRMAAVETAVTSRLSAVESSVTGMRHELNTQNTYVRTLVENSMKP